MPQHRDCQCGSARPECAQAGPGNSTPAVRSSLAQGLQIIAMVELASCTHTTSPKQRHLCITVLSASDQEEHTVLETLGLVRLIVNAM